MPDPTPEDPKEDVAALRAELAELRERVKAYEGGPGELETLRAELGELKTKAKSGEIRGMSESTAHALLESVKALTAELKQAKPADLGQPPVEKDDSNFWLPPSLR